MGDGCRAELRKKPRRIRCERIACWQVNIRNLERVGGIKVYQPGNCRYVSFQVQAEVHHVSRTDQLRPAEGDTERSRAKIGKQQFILKRRASRAVVKTVADGKDVLHPDALIQGGERARPDVVGALQNPAERCQAWSGATQRDVAPHVCAS